MSTHHHSPGDARPFRTQGGRGPMRLGYTYRDASGTSARKYFQSSARRDADARREIAASLAAFQAELARGAEALTGRQRLMAYLDSWLASLSVTQRRPLTRSSYGDVVERVRGRIPDLRLDELRPAHLDALFVRLLADGYAPYTVVHTRRALGTALGAAVRAGLIPANPVAHSTAISVPEAHRHYLSATEGAALLTAPAQQADPWLALWWVLLTTGCRIGEALGLRWGDVDERAGLLTFAGQWGKLPGESWVWQPALKTRLAVRTLPLLPATADALAAHRERQTVARLARSDWEERAMVFPGLRGQPPSRSTIHKALARALVRVGVAPARVHDLRHSAATRLLAEGEQLSVIAAVLGHSSIAVTSRVYAHVERPALTAAIGRLGAAFAPRPFQSPPGPQTGCDSTHKASEHSLHAESSGRQPSFAPRPEMPENGPGNGQPRGGECAG